MGCKVAKIEYVRNGIYSYCKSDIKDIISSLEKARVISSSLSCPSGFQYKNYINSLRSVISGYVGIAENIDKILDSVSKEYDNLNEKLKNDVSFLDSSLVKERERLII